MSAEQHDNHTPSGSAGVPDVDTLAAGIGDAMANAVTLTSMGDLERAASMIDLHAERLSDLAAIARENMSKESGLALIEDARRWQRAYNKARDELATTEANLRAATDLLTQAEKVVPGLIQTAGRFVIGDVAEARDRAEGLARRVAELEQEPNEYAAELEKRVDRLMRERDNATSMVAELEDVLRDVDKATTEIREWCSLALSREDSDAE